MPDVAAPRHDRLHLGGEVTQERVVDADLAARDEGAGLAEVDDDQVTMAKQGDVKG